MNKGQYTWQNRETPEGKKKRIVRNKITQNVSFKHTKVEWIDIPFTSKDLLLDVQMVRYFCEKKYGIPQNGDFWKNHRVHHENPDGVLLVVAVEHHRAYHKGYAYKKKTEYKEFVDSLL